MHWHTHNKKDLKHTHWNIAVLSSCIDLLHVLVQMSVRWLWQSDSADNGRSRRECRAACTH